MRKIVLVALVFIPFSAQAQDVAPLTEDEKIHHLLNRFTPGATADLVAEVKKAGLMEWFDAQLKPDVDAGPRLEESIKKLEVYPLKLDEIYTRYNGRYSKTASADEKAAAIGRSMQAMREHLAWTVARVVYSANPVRETSADFFRNHFSISIDKPHEEWMFIGWERNVIHKHALTSFNEILDASAHNIAMLFFLDQTVSRRPYSQKELEGIFSHVRRTTQNDQMAEQTVEASKRVAPNENYARELLELHTLGVDNGYTQQDVIEVSKCLTGWTMGKTFPWMFEFDPDMHVKGPKTVLGQTIPAETGDSSSDDGEKVLEILKKHPNTAAYLSTKLVRFYVNDDPDPKMVARVAKVFGETGGDLPKVFKAIVTDPEFFLRKNYLAKFKRPSEFLYSMLRAVGAQSSGAMALAGGVQGALDRLTEGLYKCPDPTGYYDQAEAWRDPGALATRWTVATELSRGRLASVKIPETLYGDLPEGKPKEWKAILTKKILPVGGLTARTSGNLDRIIAAELKKNPKATAKDLGPTIVAILLGSPEFQKQ